MVGQLAKSVGLRVVGVAGSGEKCSWLVDELGFDAALNYKSPELKKAFATAVPNGVDIYFENTGGPIQQLAYDRMNTRSEEHTSELQSLMRISYAVFCLNKQHTHKNHKHHVDTHDNLHNQPNQ